MSKQKEFLDVEETAQKLTKNLEVLHEQVGSYKTAREELEKTREDLSKLIEKTRLLAEGTYETIKRINEIGAAKILNRIEKTRLLTEEARETIKRINEIGITKILNRIKLNFIISITGFTVLIILGIIIILKVF